MLHTDQGNPDSNLFVTFYDGVVRANYDSEKAGRPIVRDTIRIKIAIPGNQTLEIDEPLEGDKLLAAQTRFPMQWAHYTNQRSDASMSGTPVEELTFLTRAAVENLKHAKFHTVEQIANGVEQNLRGLGMSCGMDPLALRDKAIRYLEVAQKNSGFTQLEQKLAEKDTESAAMRGEMQRMAEMIAELQAQATDPKGGKLGLPSKDKPREAAA